MKILVVDDEDLLVKGIRFNLQNDGYEVITGSNGLEAVAAVQAQNPDLVILDVMMPEMDGLEACNKIREFSNVPIILLTAKTDDMDVLMGFENGADDYLTKPFNILELKARIRAMLRRKDTYLPDLLAIGSVILNRSTYQLVFQDKIQTLSGKEFQILEMMMQAPGTIIPTDRFITHLWGWDTNVDTSVVWVHISNLRKKISAIGAPMEIRFIRNAGYVLEVKP